MIFRRLSLLILSGCLFACSSKPEPSISYYLLPYQSVTQNKVDEVKLTVSIADYLKNDNLVVENNLNQLQFAHYHRWAQPVDLAIKQYLQKRLIQLNEVQKSYTNTSTTMSYRLSIERLHGTESGQVFLSGVWRIGGEGNSAHYFNYETKQTAAGYTNLIFSMAELLDKLANDMTAK